MSKIDWSRPRPVRPSEPVVVTRPWIRNTKGNLCREIAGVWYTVFERRGTYRFVRKGVFSKRRYPTEREACEAACEAARRAA